MMCDVVLPVDHVFLCHCNFDIFLLKKKPQMIEGSFLAVLSSHTIFSDCTLFLYDHAFFGKKYANESDRL